MYAQQKGTRYLLAKLLGSLERTRPLSKLTRTTSGRSSRCRAVFDQSLISFIAFQTPRRANLARYRSLCSLYRATSGTTPQMCCAEHRGLAAGGLALGSKAAMMAKAGGGGAGVLKGLGALTAAGGAAAAVSATTQQTQPQQARHYPPPPPQRLH